MPPQLGHVLAVLRAHRQDLQAMGVRHASVFGSVARGSAAGGSDIDILVDLDPQAPLGVFEYVGIGLRLEELLGYPTDVVARSRLKPALQDRVLGEAVDAF
jgi:uncharacterized protein